MYTNKNIHIEFYSYNYFIVLVYFFHIINLLDCFSKYAQKVQICDVLKVCLNVHKINLYKKVYLKFSPILLSTFRNIFECFRQLNFYYECIFMIKRCFNLKVETSFNHKYTFIIK